MNGFKAPAPGAVLSQPWGIWSCDGQCGMEGARSSAAGLSRALLPEALRRDTSTTLLLLMPGTDKSLLSKM